MRVYSMAFGVLVFETFTTEKKTKYMHRHTLTDRRKWHLDGKKAKIGRTHAAKTVKWVKSRKKSTTHKFHSKLAANGKIMDICAATIPKWNHFLFGSLRVGLNELLCLFSVWFWQTTTTKKLRKTCGFSNHRRL